MTRSEQNPLTTFYSASIIALIMTTSMSMAARLKPPSGMITSAYLLLGSTNSRCMGRTVSVYW